MTIIFNLNKQSPKKNISENIRYVNTDQVIAKQNRLLKQCMTISMSGDKLNIAFSKMLNILKGTYNIDYCTLLLDIDNTNDLSIVYSDVDNSKHDSLNAFIKENSMEIDMRIFKSAETSHLSYSAANNRFIKFAILMPLKTKNTSIGTLLIEKTSLDDIKILEDESLKTIAETLTFSIDNIMLHEKFKNLAIKDQLTKAYNRTYLYSEFLPNNLNRSYALAMIDIDFFKKVNDTYGHAGGDEVLKAVSSSLSSSLGENGTVFRYGGEEFLIFLQDSNSNFISQVLEKTRSNIENLTVPYRDQVINITISIGVATTQSIKQNSISSINNSSMPAEEEFGLIRDLADEALYQAKSEGRNRIINYPNI